jgi:AmmeMemoRadiSam system protein A
MTPGHGEILLRLARAAIGAALERPRLGVDDAPWLREPGASFVTLMRHGELRGCIGSLEPYRPLREDVEDNACMAAFRDPRFPALTSRDYASIEVEVAVLSALTPVDLNDEDDALAQLRPGIDGIVFQYRHHRSTFLPQVWEHLPEPREFLAHLKKKAGLPADFWDPLVSLSRYTVYKWRERDLAARRGRTS